MKEVILLMIFCHIASPVMHSLKYFYTGSSEVPNFPEFVTVGMVDELQMVHYDSNTQRAVPKQDWMDQVTRDEPGYWERENGNCQSSQQVFKANIDTAKQRFNQTGGVHVVQVMLGCEWDDETGETDGYHQHGYDGEDFISFDLKTLRWIAPNQQSFITQLKWDHNRAYNEYWKNYHTQICIDWLKKYLSYGKSVLQRTERPSVSLLQKSPSSPVSCHATGFYPASIMVMWRKDGEEVQDYGELLPNHDGTFQKAVDVDLAGVQPGDWGKYECVVKQRGVDDIITRLDQSVVRTNSDWLRIGAGGPSGVITLITMAGPVLVAMAAAVGGIILYKKKKGAKLPPPASENGSEKKLLRILMNRPA